MCEINEKTKLKNFTGYKLVITDKHGHHYSPYTGVRYQPGPVPELKKIGKYAVWQGADQYIRKDGEYNYVQSDHRLSGVFERCDNAVSSVLRRVYFDANQSSNFINDECKINIVKMTISGDLYKGEFCDNAIILGNFILKVKTTKLKILTDLDFARKSLYVSKVTLQDFKISDDEINKYDIIVYVDNSSYIKILKSNL